MLDVKEMRGQKKEELVSLEEKLRKELSQLRLRAAMGDLKETAKVGDLRREIARILTVRKEVQ